MAHPIWKGSISFGLVQIPVDLFSAENTSQKLHFHMLDKRNLAPIRYERLNCDNDEPVAWDQIVKGYEYDKGRYIIITEEDFKRANPKATSSIDILDFVDGAGLSPVFYEKPYYLAPTGKGAGAKAYALLRETMRRSGKIGIARVVIRTRQHLAALLVEQDVLVLNTLRYAHEVRKAEFDLPSRDLAELGVSEREVQMAERLIDGMLAPWQPDKYKDDYTDDLLAWIDERARKGEIESVEGAPQAPKPREGVIDIMDLLKKSLEKTEAERKPAERPGSGACTGFARSSSQRSGSRNGRRMGSFDIHPFRAFGTTRGPTRSRARSR